MAAVLLCDRVRALRALGYTPRQPRFLRLVLRCGGVCVPRQYASLAGIAPGGRKCLGFFARLVRRGQAVRLRCGHNRAHVYHVHGRALEAAFGEDATRYRRAMSPALVVRRLMRLDAALMTPDAASFAALTDIDLRGGWRANEPAAGHGDGTTAEAKNGPRRLPLIRPVGIDRVGAIVFVCLITEASPDRFRRALQGILAHLADIHRWELLVAFSAPLARLTRAYQTMVHEELESPLTEDDVQGLWRLFMCRRGGATEQPFWSKWTGVAATGYKLFTRPRFSVLYRHWMEVDAAAFEPLRSTAAADAIAEGRERVTYRTLGHDYDHLVPLRACRRDAATTMIPRRGSMPSRTASTPGLNPARFSLGPLLTLEAAGAGVLVARCHCKNSKQMPTERSCPCSRCRSVAGSVRSRSRSASGKHRGVNDRRLRSAKCAPCPVGSFTPRFRVQLSTVSQVVQN
jgi:hypothetical protein